MPAMADGIKFGVLRVKYRQLHLYGASKNFFESLTDFSK